MKIIRERYRVLQCNGQKWHSLKAGNSQLALKLPNVLEHFIRAVKLLSLKVWRISWLWKSLLMNLYNLKLFLFAGRKARKNLMSWLVSRVPRHLLDKGFPDSFRDGILLCALLESLVPGSCPRFDLLDPDQPLMNLKLAFHLLRKYLQVQPDISPNEILCHGEYITEELLLLLAQLKMMSDRLKPPTPVLKYFRHSNGTFQHSFVSSKCFAKGIGLMLAVQNRSAFFTIFLQSIDDLDLIVEIGGPQNTVGNIKITNISEIIGSNSPKFDCSLDSETKAFILCKRIPLRFQMFENQIKICYTPLKVGVHKLSIICEGMHTIGSPYNITVTNEEESPDIWSIAPKTTLESLETKTSFGSKHMNDFTVCQKLEVSKKKTILKYIVKLDGRDVVIDGKEDLCEALNRLKLKQGNNEPLHKRKDGLAFSEDLDFCLENSPHGVTENFHWKTFKSELINDSVANMNPDEVKSDETLLHSKIVASTDTDKTNILIPNNAALVTPQSTFIMNPDSYSNIPMRKTDQEETSCIFRTPSFDSERRPSNDDTDHPSKTDLEETNEIFRTAHFDSERRPSNDDIGPLSKTGLEETNYIFRTAHFDSKRRPSNDDTGPLSKTNLEETNYIFRTAHFDSKRRPSNDDTGPLSKTDLEETNDIFRTPSFDSERRSSNDDAGLYPVYKVEYEPLQSYDSDDLESFNEHRRTSFTELHESNYLEDDASDSVNYIDSVADSREEFEDVKYEPNSVKSECNNFADASKSSYQSRFNHIQCDYDLGFWSETINETSDECLPSEECRFGKISPKNVSKLWDDKLRELEASLPCPDFLSQMESFAENTLENRDQENVQDVFIDAGCSSASSHSFGEIVTSSSQVSEEMRKFPLSLGNASLLNISSDSKKRLSWSGLPSIPEISVENNSENELTDSPNFKHQFPEGKSLGKLSSELETKNLCRSHSMSLQSGEIRDRLPSMINVSASSNEVRCVGELGSGSSFHTNEFEIKSAVTMDLEPKSGKGFIVAHTSPAVNQNTFDEFTHYESKNVTAVGKPSEATILGKRSPEKVHSKCSKIILPSDGGKSSIHDISSNHNTNESLSIKCPSVKKVLQIFQREKEEPLDRWPSSSHSLLSFCKRKKGTTPEKDCCQQSVGKEAHNPDINTGSPKYCSIKDRVRLFEKNLNKTSI